MEKEKQAAVMQALVMELLAVRTQISFCSFQPSGQLLKTLLKEWCAERENPGYENSVFLIKNSHD